MNERLKPGRALFAERGEDRATATFVKIEGRWTCESASHHLKFLIGMDRPDEIKTTLAHRRFKWYWMQSTTTRKSK